MHQDNWVTISYGLDKLIQQEFFISELVTVTIMLKILHVDLMEESTKFPQIFVMYCMEKIFLSLYHSEIFISLFFRFDVIMLFVDF